MLKAEGLSVHFKRRFGRGLVKALDGFDLELNERDFFALLGQNGAGKTTAMQCFLGILRPTSGRVRLFGETPRPGAKCFAKVGYLPEEPIYHDYLTVQEAIDYYGRLAGGREFKKRADTLLERLDLAQSRNRRLAKCSKGMKQKLGIIQCLLCEPRLLLLDEPMRGLDPLAVREFRKILVEMNRGGTTIVMNSHILSEVELVATRAAILDKGRVVAEGKITDLVGRSEETYSVQVEGGHTLPDYFVHSGEIPEGQEGRIPASKLGQFVEFARTEGVTLLSCSLQKGTLEDAFLRVLKGDAAAR